jgi:exo-1,4-beta-D-glucosaminidase
MPLTIRIPIVSLISLMTFTGVAEAQTTTLSAGWQIQSSASVPEKGEQISTAAYRPSGWTSASVPTTVVGALVTSKQLPDPMIGMNLRSFPGTSYPIGRNFSGLAMPADSPYAVPWWFRTSFTVPASMRGRRISLRFDGITYRADVWLNGAKIAASDQVAGTYRMYEFDVTDRVINGANTLAVEVFPPQPDDLAWTWVDWNPMPPDKNMGLWRPVTLSASGDVTIRHSFVSAHVDSSLGAAMTVSAELRNLTRKPVRGTLRGQVERVAFEQRVELAAGESRSVEFTPEAFPELRAPRPRLWWPIDMGAPNLYDLTLEFVPADSAVISDRASIRFGIREITSSLTPQGGRQFFINGRPIVIRGGGWAPDMLLRTDPDRLDAELRYVRDVHLNTIRLEGKLEQEALFDKADEYGILVLAGWCCCDQWEQWAKWKPENRAIAAESQHDQICRLRRHPSVLAWLNGSDNPPPADIEQMYVDILKKLNWPNRRIGSPTPRTAARPDSTPRPVRAPRFRRSRV